LFQSITKKIIRKVQKYQKSENIQVCRSKNEVMFIIVKKLDLLLLRMIAKKEYFRMLGSSAGYQHQPKISSILS